MHHSWKALWIGWACLLMAVLVFLPAGSASAAQADVPRFEPAECMYQEQVAFVEGKDVECGYLIVPEEYNNPNGKTLRLAVVILRSLDANPQPDPIVMAQGGPGGSTIYTYLQAFQLNPQLRGDRDYILFDQRGTLYSEPRLDCPEAFDAMLQMLDKDVSEEEAMQSNRDVTSQCRARLASEGVNLNAFDSLENAHDVESLRVALGYEKINLYGVSYGTLLAQHVLRLYPEGLRSVTLDAVVPTETNFLLNAPHTMNDSLEALFASCAADRDCNAAYPNLRQVFYDLVDRLNAEPVMLRLQDFETLQTYDALLDGDGLMSSVFQMMYATELIPHMPRTIYGVRDGDYAFFERLMSVLTFDRSTAYGMYNSVMCAEDADFTVQDYRLDNLPPQIVEMEDTTAQYFLETCQIWDVQALPATVDEPVQSDVPVLLFSGVFDPITPPRYAEAVAAGMPNSYQFVFPAGAHGALTSGDCQDQIFLDFVDDPSRAPDASCIQATTGPAFVTPKSVVALPVLIKLLNLTDGTGWQALVYLLALGFLALALLIYPMVWLVRRLRRQPAAVPVVSEPGTAWEPLQPEKRGGLYRFAPWLAAGTALALLIFTVAVVVILVRMVTTADILILVGLPGSARPLFVLPLLAAAGAALMLAAMLAGWLRPAGSLWGRLFFSLVTFAALAAVGVLALWGFLTALV